ncbi:restriction endonuclease [Methylobacterium terrae]|uniref:Restriction endonuclease n=1 Tax=Methylobacterium terrae TaxID=2202827 RepID=A0A2U8WJV6_9HYPH|nr:restriction endonuclease [Methylobacterium terrae]AWN46447.1 restriction endonuclease [Methylobacterium terrae]
MIDWTEILDGDTWELFARDYFAESGFTIDVGPGRGVDAGRDIVISEQLNGKINTKKFVWLVSCKHYAKSNKSVGPGDEQNITDRIRQHRADGFIGFYSTVPSSGLIERFKSLHANGDISAYELIDGRKIEQRFVTTGSSKLALRYFPDSYRRSKPIQKLLDKHVELRCKVCDEDLLSKSMLGPFSGVIVTASKRTEASDGRKFDQNIHVYAVCKGECDRRMDRMCHRQGFSTGWEDIDDLCNPLLYIKAIMAIMNRLRAKRDEYTDEAFSDLKNIFIAISQRTLREITEEDGERASQVIRLQNLGF